MCCVIQHPKQACKWCSLSCILTDTIAISLTNQKASLKRSPFSTSLFPPIPIYRLLREKINSPPLQLQPTSAMRQVSRMAFLYFYSILDRQKNEKNHFLTSVILLPRLTYRPSLRSTNALPQTRILPAFFRFKGNDLLLILKLQLPSGGGQPPEPSPI